MQILQFDRAFIRNLTANSIKLTCAAALALTMTLGLLIITGGVLGLVVLLLEPSGGDLAALSTFLLLFGGATIALALGVRRYGLPFPPRTLKGRLVFVSVITASIALANVGFIALLMFLSTHDLALLAGLLGFSLALSIVVALAMSETMLHGLKDLVAATHRMSRGELETRVSIDSSDEIGGLGKAFNQMAERLERSFARQKDIENARRVLVTAVSHDLRTPLASIRVMVESINDGVVTDDDTIKRYLRLAQSETEHLTQLIDDLFDLSQMDAGSVQLHLASSSLADLISDTIAAMAPQAHSRGLRLEGAADESLSPIEMDSPRVQRVLGNLVQNAIRHTPPDGTIFVKALDAESEVEVHVQDTGEGIPQTELNRIFERSYRLDQSRTRESGGAGLGLTIAKGIVEAHGGRIWARSVFGRGSTFTFTLPKHVEAAPRSQLAAPLS